MLTDERRSEFHEAVATHHLKTDAARSDKPLRILGVLLMVAGAIGTFVAYNASLAFDDLRDVASSQILALAFLSLAVIGSALYIAGAVARVLRLWLLRQLVESQDRADELLQALRRR